MQAQRETFVRAYQERFGDMDQTLEAGVLLSGDTGRNAHLDGLLHGLPVVNILNVEGKGIDVKALKAAGIERVLPVHFDQDRKSVV